MSEIFDGRVTLIKENNMIRRNLSGIYIFDKFPNEDKRRPTCIEDCQEETRINWLKSLEIEALHRVADVLNECSDRIYDMLKPKEKIIILGPKQEGYYCSKEDDKDSQIECINSFCNWFCGVADLFGIRIKDDDD